MSIEYFALHVSLDLGNVELSPSHVLFGITVDAARKFMVCLGTYRFMYDFQGGMKRHGMKGGPASHGASLSHRGLGSVGPGGDPGRVCNALLLLMSFHLKLNRTGCVRDRFSNIVIIRSI